MYKRQGTDNESASIATQKSILTDYVKKQGWHLAKTYVDDGYSGTNFQRPSFQNMIKDIESGLINCVITKDLSRLGRNYLDCGLYLEVFFPEHNVRYIAVNDGVDTLNKSAMDITPFRNILNEMYSADVSVKIKSAYRARFQQGKFMGTTAPYGYVCLLYTSSDGLIVQLEDYLKDYPNSRLIVIDTLQKVRTASKDNAYASDYGDISLIKDFADRHSLAVIVVHLSLIHISIISLGRSLDFQVIAEYVESEEIRDTLKKLGCDLYQGYLYSPAVPLEHIKRMQFGRNISNSKGESPEEQTSYV